MNAKFFRGDFVDLETNMNEFFEENKTISIKHVKMVSLGVKNEDGEPMSEIMILYEEK